MGTISAGRSIRQRRFPSAPNRICEIRTLTAGTIPAEGARCVVARGTTLLVPAGSGNISRLLRSWEPSTRPYLPSLTFFGRLLQGAFAGDRSVPGLHNPRFAGGDPPGTFPLRRRYSVYCVPAVATAPYADGASTAGAESGTRPRRPGRASCRSPRPPGTTVAGPGMDHAHECLHGVGECCHDLLRLHPTVPTIADVGDGFLFTPTGSPDGGYAGYAAALVCIEGLARAKSCA